MFGHCGCRHRQSLFASSFGSHHATWKIHSTSVLWILNAYSSVDVDDFTTKSYAVDGQNRPIRNAGEVTCFLFAFFRLLHICSLIAMRAYSLSVLALSVGAVLPTSAFLRPHLCLRCKHLQAPRKIAFIRRFVGPRYGPNKDNVADDSGTTNVVDVEQENWERQEAARVAQQQIEFRRLIQDVISTANPEHLPSIMTKHMDLLLSMRGYEGAALIEGVLREAKEKGEDQQIMGAIEYILSFAEMFVDQAQTLDDYNKKLLGKIIKTITNKGSARDKEELLDELMESEKGNFTPGFLKHVEGECERIAHAPVMTPESSRLLQILLMIQARVLEELGSVRSC